MPVAAPPCRPNRFFAPIAFKLNLTAYGDSLEIAWATQILDGDVIRSLAASEPKKGSFRAIALAQPPVSGRHIAVHANANSGVGQTRAHFAVAAPQNTKPQCDKSHEKRMLALHADGCFACKLTRRRGRWRSSPVARVTRPADVEQLAKTGAAVGHAAAGVRWRVKEMVGRCVFVRSRRAQGIGTCKR